MSAYNLHDKELTSSACNLSKGWNKYNNQQCLCFQLMVWMKLSRPLSGYHYELTTWIFLKLKSKNILNKKIQMLPISGLYETSLSTCVPTGCHFELTTCPNSLVLVVGENQHDLIWYFTSLLFKHFEICKYLYHLPLSVGPSLTHTLSLDPHRLLVDHGVSNI